LERECIFYKNIQLASIVLASSFLDVAGY